MLLALTAAAVAAGTSAQTSQHCFTGYAYHRDSGEFVYTKHHEQRRRDERVIDWRVTYRGPDGDVRRLHTYPAE